MKLPQDYWVVVHDEMDIYQWARSWHNNADDLFKPGMLDALQKAKGVIVISESMHQRLKPLVPNCYHVPTTSTVPSCSPKPSTASAVTVFQPGRRKNASMLKRVLSRSGISYMMHTPNGNKLPFEEYIKLLDRHSIYVCASRFEGGPLPAMDAMNRGLVVVATPVGQMPELIEDGVNGFLCTSSDQIVERLRLLQADQDLLMRMRLKSSETLKGRKQIIQRRLRTVLEVI
jgi:glycosyltransferase involved in cell wall biosynthesis